MTLRAPTLEDRALILALLNEAEVAETGAPVSELADVDDLFATPGLDLKRRARVQIDRGRAVALVAVHPAPQPDELRAQLILAPSAQRAAPSLLRLINAWSTEDRAGSAPATTTLVELPSFLGRDALVSDGWEVVHSYTRMHTQLDGVRPIPPLKQYTIRAAQSDGDIRAVHEVLELALAGQWKHQRRTSAEFLRNQESRSGHDPALWFLAEQDGVAAGAVIARDPVDRAWIAWLGVHPAHRRRGTAGSLLPTAFNELFRRGHRTVGVDVDTHNQAGALDVYRQAGMAVTAVADQWSKTVG